MNLPDETAIFTFFQRLVFIFVEVTMVAYLVKVLWQWVITS